MNIDIHAHYVSPKIVDLVTEGKFSPELTVKKIDDSIAFSFPTGITRKFFDSMTDTEKRIKHMDELSIDIEVLSTWVDVYGYDLPRQLASKYSSAINESLALKVMEYKDRFRFVATVPLPWGKEAAVALRDSVERLGAIGSMIGTNIGGVNLDDPRFEPFWQASEELSAPVILHPLNVAGIERLRSYYLSNLIGNPFETAIAASSLIFSGIMDRYPELKVILLHGGGYFPHGIGRLNHYFGVRQETKMAKSEPSSYLRRFYYDSIVFDSKIMCALVGLVGEDRILIGSDYPFDMEPRKFMEMLESVFGEKSSSLLKENTMRAFPRLQ
ncbi:MAG: amidohydrolase family protein [Nitrososphaerales archaeon]